MHPQLSPTIPAAANQSDSSQRPPPQISLAPPATLPNEELRTKNQELPTATLTALADLLATTRGVIRDLAHRLGFRFHSEFLGARRKRTACLTADQAEVLISTYHADLAQGPPLDESDLEPPDRNLGVVYLLQLEPDFDAGRFKVGFTHTPWTRLNDLLTVAPLAQCVAMWPSRRNWERAAITAIAQFATQIREEVYRGADIEVALRAGDKFFAAMPAPARHRPKLPPPRHAEANLRPYPPPTEQAGATVPADTPLETRPSPASPYTIVRAPLAQAADAPPAATPGVHRVGRTLPGAPP